MSVLVLVATLAIPASAQDPGSYAGHDELTCVGDSSGWSQPSPEEARLCAQRDAAVAQRMVLEAIAAPLHPSWGDEWNGDHQRMHALIGEIGRTLDADQRLALMTELQVSTDIRKQYGPMTRDDAYAVLYQMQAQAQAQNQMQMQMQSQMLQQSHETNMAIINNMGSSGVTVTDQYGNVQYQY